MFEVKRLFKIIVLNEGTIRVKMMAKTDRVTNNSTSVNPAMDRGLLLRGISVSKLSLQRSLYIIFVSLFCAILDCVGNTLVSTQNNKVAILRTVNLCDSLITLFKALSLSFDQAHYIVNYSTN